MSMFLNAFKDAFLLIFRGNADFYRVLLMSLFVSGLATVVGTLMGIPLGVWLAEFQFKGRKTLLVLVHTGMGLPPVVVGVFAFLLLAESGPLGSLNFIFTWKAMVVVQIVLATPIIAGFTHAALVGVDRRIGMQAMSLGATRLQAIGVKMRESRAGLVAAIIAGFGGVISEVGAVMIVGGNLYVPGGGFFDQTRVMTTDIVMKTRLGNYQLALAEGIVLLLIALVINAFLTRMQTEKSKRTFWRARVTGYAD